MGTRSVATLKGYRQNVELYEGEVVITTKPPSRIRIEEVVSARVQSPPGKVGLFILETSSSRHEVEFYHEKYLSQAETIAHRIDPPKPAPSLEEDEKRCPACAETIKAAAKKCKHCGEIVETWQAPRERPVAKSPPEKKKGGCLTKGCLLFFVVFFVVPIISILTREKYQIRIQVEPEVQAFFKVEGDGDGGIGIWEDSGTKVLFRLPEGRYQLEVTAEGYKAYRGDFQIPKNKNLSVSLESSSKKSSSSVAQSKKVAKPKKAKNDGTDPFKLVNVLSNSINFGGMECALEVEGAGWHKSNVDGRWNAVLKRSFGQNEVSCLLESNDSEIVQRIELEAEFYQPGSYEDAMLLQFAQSSQVLMHPNKVPKDFAEAVVNKTGWSNNQWELTRDSYANGGFGLMLRKK